ncbi:MAG: NAD(P)H-dependent oxidoreductase subunit E [Acidobacteria bacterium]|nr:NAD(P)H-dependent oxidoreductase subunit E [Acidobacteriota bacterium]
MIIEALREIQHRDGFLSAGELQRLSSRFKVPLYELQGLAGFFPHFRLELPPALDVRVCADMSCRLSGAAALHRSVEVMAEERFSGRMVVEEVSCLGQCDRAPAFAINDVIFNRTSTGEIPQLLAAAVGGERLKPAPALRHEAELRTDPYCGERHFDALRALLESKDATKALAELKASQLRGMGGAGFPAGTKWEIVRNTRSDQKYIVCNADESEPGTIKDRFILEALPHLLIEGMIIAGYLTGAGKGIIYLRHEYEAQRAVIQAELERCRRDGLLGPSVLGTGFTFELDLFISPGGYICGEETALLEVIEDRRAQPRNKPPFPVTHGLFNKPTVLNNVETFVYVPFILMRGADAFRSQGVNGCSGLKFVGVSGHVNHPGVFEVPMGTPVREVIFHCAGGVSEGRSLKAFAPSGASSGFLPASMVDIHLDFKILAEAGSMLGSGAIVAIAEGTCMIDMAMNGCKFFRNESCGKCVPCRVGSQKAVDILASIQQGRATEADLAVVDELAETLMLTSICGLGQVAANPFTSVLKHFRNEVEDHLRRKRCPSGVCFQPGPPDGSSRRFVTHRDTGG